MTGRPVLSPAQTALLVMDFQAAVLGRVPDSADLVVRMSDIIAARRPGRPVSRS